MYVCIIYKLYIIMYVCISMLCNQKMVSYIILTNFNHSIHFQRNIVITSTLYLYFIFSSYIYNRSYKCIYIYIRIYIDTYIHIWVLTWTHTHTWSNWYIWEISSGRIAIISWNQLYTILTNNLTTTWLSCDIIWY